MDMTPRTEAQRPPTVPAPWLGRLALVMVPVAMLAFLLLRPSTNSDIFWQLKLGGLVLANHGPLASEPFAVTHLGEPAQNLAWAGQALFALVRECSGWPGLRLVDALCWLGGFWVVALACARRGDPPLAVAAGLVFGFIAALPTAVMRPQSFASLCFGLLLVLLGARIPAAARVLLGAVLLAVWQNLHPSVGLALGVCGIAAALGWWRWWRDRSAPLPLAETLLAVLALAAQFATPDGLAILETSARNGEFSIMIGVGEWLPLWAPVNRQVALPVLAAVVLALLAVRRNLARIDPGEALTCLALFGLTLLFHRFVLFWGIALIPVVARGARLGEAGPAGPATLSLAGLGVAATGLAITLLHPVTFREHIPLAAVERLRMERLKGTVFSDFTLGGVVIDAGYPDWKVAYDGRYYRYTRAEWERFAAIQSGQVGMRAIEARYDPVAWVLRPERNARLMAELDRNPARWRRLVADANVAIYVPAHRAARAVR